MFTSVDICGGGGDIFRGVPTTGEDMSGCGYSTQSSVGFKLAIDDDADLQVVDSMCTVGKNLMDNVGTSTAADIIPNDVHIHAQVYKILQPRYENGRKQDNTNDFDSNVSVSKQMAVDIQSSTRQSVRTCFNKKTNRINHSKCRGEMLTSILHACYMANSIFSARLVIRRFVKYIKASA